MVAGATAFAGVLTYGCGGEGTSSRETVGVQSQAVFGVTSYDNSCHPDDIPNLDLAFTYGRIAVNSPAFAECIDAAFQKQQAFSVAGAGPVLIGPYDACIVTGDGSPDPATPGPGTILATTKTPNPTLIKCDYSQAVNSTEGGYAQVGSVHPGDLTTVETINLGNALAGIAGTSVPCFNNPSNLACASEQSLADAAGTILHEIMHQHGYDHTGFNPGNACTMPADQLCGIPCSQNPYYGSSVPYMVGECVRAVLEDSAANCPAMHDKRCGGLTLQNSIFSSSPTCSCVSGHGSAVGDYDGDGKTDLAVWRPSVGNWYTIESSDSTRDQEQWGTSGDEPIVGDYDGDGTTDRAVWRSSNGNWYIIYSSNGSRVTTQWGTSGDVPVPGDYDGDGKTDVAVWRPSNGNWYVLNSSNGAQVVTQWGTLGDIPVPGDYDGDRTFDLTVWRPSNGTWYQMYSSDRSVHITQWGASGDYPAAADYDGDSKSDLAVWRPSNGTWYVTYSSDAAQRSTQWGTSGDIPVPGDYDGDGSADFAVWRPSNGTWYMVYSSNVSQQVVPWGTNGDIPLPRLP